MWNNGLNIHVSTTAHNNLLSHSAAMIVQLLAFYGSCMYSLTLSSQSLHQGIIFIIVCESGVPTTQKVYFRGR